MAAVVGDIVVSLRADIASLRSDLDKARGAMKQTRDEMRGHAEGIQGMFHSLRPELRGISELTRGLGTVAGETQNELVKVGRELILGFGASGPIGIAIAGAALLFTALTDKAKESGEVAAEAAKKGGEASDAEKKKIKDKLDVLNEYIKAQKESRAVAQGGELQVKGKEALTDIAKQYYAQKGVVMQAARDLADAAGTAEYGALYAKSKEEQKKLVALQNEFDATRLALQKQHNVETAALFREGQTQEAQDSGDRGKREADDLKARTAVLLEFQRAAVQYEKDKQAAIKKLQLENEAVQTGLFEERDKENMDRIRRQGEISTHNIEQQKEIAARQMQEAQSMAQSLGQTFTQFLLAPMQEGFKGLASFAEMAKQMLIGLIEKLIAAAIAAAILMVLLPTSTFATNFGQLAGIGQVIGTAAGAGKAQGGYISGPGTGTSDSVYARLSNGEYVMPADAVKMWGVGMMDAMAGKRGFSHGGVVSGGGGGGIPGGHSSVVYNVMAFDAPAIGRSIGRVEAAEVNRFDNRQGQLLRQRIRDSVG